MFSLQYECSSVKSSINLTVKVQQLSFNLFFFTKLALFEEKSTLSCFVDIKRNVENHIKIDSEFS